MKPTAKKILLGILILGPLLWGLLWFRAEGRLIPLPVYGDQEMDGSTTPWVIPDFELTDQDSHSFNRQDLQGKIVVANFFYATCPGICPRMNDAVKMVAYKYKDHPDVCFVSHSVNPEADSVPVLREYADRFKYPTQKWRFVTGPKSVIYSLAEDHYRVVATKASGPDDFIHSTTIVLLDKELRIRGYFESMDNPNFYSDLKGGIQALIKEYKDRES